MTFCLYAQLRFQVLEPQQRRPRHRRHKSQQRRPLRVIEARQRLREFCEPGEELS